MSYIEEELVEDEELLLVKDVMSTPPITVTPETTVKDIARIMSVRGIGSVIVVDERGEIIGIITETDLIKRVLAPGLKPNATRANDVMTRKVVKTYASDKLSDAVYRMKDYGIGHLPVVDIQAGKLVGVISKTDVALLSPMFMELLYISKGRKTRKAS
ncbi:MAG: CBS domain-containing protein [Desulfurococcales archaeon]|nr:CBS domain-containing protein [Desulfurococcales archaeon]